MPERFKEIKKLSAAVLAQAVRDAKKNPEKYEYDVLSADYKIFCEILGSFSERQFKEQLKKIIKENKQSE